MIQQGGDAEESLRGLQLLQLQQQQASSAPTYCDENELQLFLNEEATYPQEMRTNHELFTDLVLSAISSAPVNKKNEISLEQLANELNKLPKNAALVSLLDVFGGIHEKHIPKDAVVNLWVKMTTCPSTAKRKKPRAKSASSVRSTVAVPNTPSHTRTVLESKRKQAEYDLQLLQNRVFLLQQEEARAWKKIQQTKERAKTILDQRQANLLRQETQCQLAQERQLETKLAHKKQVVSKKESFLRKKQATIQLISKKFQDVEQVKSERQRLKELKECNLLEQLADAKEKRQAIRNHELASRAKLQQQKQQHETANSVRAFQQMIEQERTLQQQQQRVQAMEKLESELIQRLKGTQLIQKEAYSVLEQALLRTEPSMSASTSVLKLAAGGSTSSSGSSSCC